MTVTVTGFNFHADYRSEVFPRMRITKRSCACDCGRRPVSVGAFFFLLLTQIRAFKLRFQKEKAMFLEGPRGGPWGPREGKMKFFFF